MEITDYKIHTRTICAKLNSHLSSHDVFELLPVKTPIISVTCDGLRKDIEGEHRSDSKRKSFGHGKLCTIELVIESCHINMKYFETTGGLQLTGCKLMSAARSACDIVAEWIGSTVLWDTFRQCGVKIGFAIRNTELDLAKLDRILQVDYGLISVYDPNSSNHGFHGIKTTLYWNEFRDGVCRCTNQVEFDKCPCLRICVTTFRTGSVGMMSGRATDEELNQVYKYYTDIIVENYADIRITNYTNFLLENFEFEKIVIRNPTDDTVKSIRTKITPLSSATKKRKLIDNFVTNPSTSTFFEALASVTDD